MCKSGKPDLHAPCLPEALHGNHIAARRDRSYLVAEGRHCGPSAARKMSRMSELASSRHSSRATLIASAAAGLIVAATIALWVHYGTAVFYEMILAGIAACF